MRNPMTRTALAAAVLAIMSAAALAQTNSTSSVEHGVTVLRGSTSGAQSSNTPAATGPQSAAPLSNGVVNSGSSNATVSGSANAGGENANPPPGMGR